jgi:ribosomal-protein-alanine N-acetyltransferase
MFEDMERVEANVIKDNKLALHLDKKCGFKEEGVLRHYIKIDSKYHDVVILSYLRKDYENNGKI